MHSHGNQGDSQSSSQNAQDLRPLGSAAGIDARPILGVALGVVAACLLASIFLVDVPVGPAPQTVFAQSGPRVMAIQSSTQPDVVNVTGEGFTPGERVGIYVEPVSTDKTDIAARTPIKVIEALVDGMGRIHALLTARELQQTPYAQAVISVHTRNDQYRAEKAVDLSHIPLVPIPESTPSTLAPVSGPGDWLRETFSEPALSGEASAPEIVGDVGCASKRVINASNSTSARWTQQLNVDRYGNFVFTLTASGSARLYVDNQPLIDAWYDNSKQKLYRQQTHLSKGMHNLRVEYAKSSRNCHIALDVQPYYPNWHASIYDNDTLEGPVLAELSIDPYPNNTSSPKLPVEISASLQITWENAPAAEIRVDHFSANITRTISITESGNYQITLRVGERDQARLFVNRKNILGLSEWSDQPERTSTLFLSKCRNCLVQLQFRDIDGPASIQLIFTRV